MRSWCPPLVSDCFHRHSHELPPVSSSHVRKSERALDHTTHDCVRYPCTLTPVSHHAECPPLPPLHGVHAPLIQRRVQRTPKPPLGMAMAQQLQFTSTTACIVVPTSGSVHYVSRPVERAHRAPLGLHWPLSSALIVVNHLGQLCISVCGKENTVQWPRFKALAGIQMWTNPHKPNKRVCTCTCDTNFTHTRCFLLDPCSQMAFALCGRGSRHSSPSRALPRHPRRRHEHVPRWQGVGWPSLR
jgi:hypothetical protein